MQKPSLRTILSGAFKVSCLIAVLPAACDQRTDPEVFAVNGDTLALPATYHMIGNVPTLEVVPTAYDGMDLIGSIADVAGREDGGFAVADRMHDQVLVFDSSGRIERSIARAGKGPGEISQPWALIRSGGSLILYQPLPDRAFTVYQPDGALRSSIPAAIEGDWRNPTFRLPSLSMDGEQRSPEDVTRRLSRWDDTSFVFLVQDNERSAGAHAQETAFSPKARLIRYSERGALLDTPAVFNGTNVRYRDQVLRTVRFEQPLFSAGPVWAVGEGWLALGHGDSSRVVISDLNGNAIGVISISGDRRPISREDKLNAARWILDARVLNNVESRAAAESALWIENRRGLRWTAFENTPMAELQPRVAGAMGLGNCLLLQAFKPEDHYDGAGLSLLVVNVRTLRPEYIIRLSPPDLSPAMFFGSKGARLADTKGTFVFAVARNGDGAWYVARYKLPHMECLGLRGHTENSFPRGPV